MSNVLEMLLGKSLRTIDFFLSLVFFLLKVAFSNYPSSRSKKERKIRFSEKEGGVGRDLKFTEFKLVLSFRNGNYSNSKPNACFQIGLKSDSRKGRNNRRHSTGSQHLLFNQTSFLTFLTGGFFSPQIVSFFPLLFFFNTNERQRKKKRESSEISIQVTCSKVITT